MPYKSTEDLPENVQHVLPAHAHDRESRRFPPSSDRAYFERACFFAGTLKVWIWLK
jgi:cation transport regulator ChaB